MECGKCKQEIRLQKVSYNNKDYHNACLVCEVCRRSLRNAQEVTIAGDNLFHKECFSKYQQLVCTKCGLDVSDGGLECLGGTYHEECFLCTKCDKTLADSKIFVDGTDLYHSECYSTPFHSGRACAFCIEPITEGINFVMYRDKFLHRKCFICHICRRQLETSEKFNDVSSSVKLQLRCKGCSEHVHRGSTKFKQSPFKNM